jgi:Cu-Zn family superoxide dismutase
MIRRTLTAAAIAVSLSSVGTAAIAARQPTYAAYIVDATGKQVGVATFIGIEGGGVQIHVETTGLEPGMHGLHIHQNGSCNSLVDDKGVSTPFGAAGPHFDPQGTGHHMGPDGDGHAGDLPNIMADDSGNAATSFYDPKLSVLDGPTNIVGRSIVIHANPDNYTDMPMNGGSGKRVECGEIGPLRST